MGIEYVYINLPTVYYIYLPKRSPFRRSLMKKGALKKDKRVGSGRILAQSS